VVTVCAKGTYRLVPGREAELVAAPLPDTARRGPSLEQSALPDAIAVTQADLVPYKAKVDVLLVGSAFAGTAQPVEALVARLCIGRLDKSVGVIGDRIWVNGPYGLEPSAPKPFKSLALSAELAPRTPDNPGGFDIARRPEKGALALPNLEAVDDESLEGQYAAFGPLTPTAASRASRVTEDGWAWIANLGSQPMPPGFDYSFFNIAPLDQRLDELGSDAKLLLENLSPKHPRLETHLPSTHPTAFVVPPHTGRAAPLALTCDTVWIDTDREVMTLTWRGCLTLSTASTEKQGTVVIVASSKEHAARAQDIELLVRAIDDEGQGPVADARLRVTVPSPSSAPRGHAPQPVLEEPSTMEMDPVTLPDGLVVSTVDDVAPTHGGSADGEPRGRNVLEVADDPSTLVNNSHPSNSCK
jgi:hypothetical protein